MNSNTSYFEDSIPKTKVASPVTLPPPCIKENAKAERGTDNVNHPSHYTDGKIETIEFIEDKKLNFNLGNVVKYVSRCGKKKSKGLSTDAKALEDLKKARFYLEREIATREKEKK